MPGPTPGPFLGSMPSPDIGGASLARKLDLVCSGLAILAACSVWIGAWLSGTHAGIPLLLKTSSAVLLCGAAAGMWLMKEASGWQRLSTALVVEALGRRLAFFQGRRAVHLAPEETPAHGIAGLMEALVWHVHRLGFPSKPAIEAASAYAAIVQDSRTKAQKAVAAIYQDVEAVGEASSAFEAADGRLAADVQALDTACGGPESALAQVCDRIIALTRSVESTTADLHHMAELASGSADRAFGCQRVMSGLDDESARLAVGAEHIESLLRGLHGPAAAAGLDGSGRDSVSLGTSAREVAALALAAVAQMRTDLAGMCGHVAGAACAVQELGEQVKMQHAAGLAVAQSVRQQGDEVAGILRTLDEGRSGFVTLRASVQAVSRQALGQLSKAEALRKAAGRLPGHADAMAAVLLDLQDGVPPG